MVDYVKSLKNDLLEQFKGKKNIEALVEVVAEQFQEVYDFYEQLRTERSLYSSVGKQLDGIGDIVVLTRMEAGQLAGNPIPFEILDDDTYRQYLIYKILKNTCNCTYPDIIKAFKMFWDKPLYYSEDPEHPATMIFDTGEMKGFVDTTPLFRTPLIRAAGITLRLFARTSVEMPTVNVFIASGLGRAITATDLPVVERQYLYDSVISIVSSMCSESSDEMSNIERDIDYSYKINIGNTLSRISQDYIADCAKKLDMPSTSITETTINEITQ